MARLPRAVIAGIPHHVTQRGARRMTVFFRSSDYDLYKSLLSELARSLGVEIRAYCLMPNHVHLIVVPGDALALGRLFRTIHAHYAEIVNARNGWRGHLWQQRFASFPMDAAHCAIALDYVHDNPVRAGLVSKPEEWPWSSARAALAGEPDDLVEPFVWTSYPSRPLRPSSRDEFEQLRRCSRTGRPFADDGFSRQLEVELGRSLLPRRRGPKPHPKLFEGLDVGEPGAATRGP